MRLRVLGSVMRLSDGDCVVTDINDSDSIIGSRVSGEFRRNSLNPRKGLDEIGIKFETVEIEPLPVYNPTGSRRSIRKKKE